MRILEHTFEEYLKIVKSFHGYEAPGVVIGGLMVDAAVRNLANDIPYNAICETQSCLPDAIQILTPCTIGNGWLKIIYSGRYAMALYDKSNGEGVRVFLDAEKVEPWKEIKAWYLKLKSKSEQDSGEILREIKDAGDSILSIQHVCIKPHIAMKKHKGKIALCPKCREAYPSDSGDICTACQGETPYL